MKPLTGGNMRFGYYPGCSQISSAKGIRPFSQKSNRNLGVSLDELDGWSCCGATSGHVTNHKLANGLAMRNIMLADHQGLDNIVAPCAACYNRLILSQYETFNHPRDQERDRRTSLYKI
ncbi:MAG: hypothetical protein IPG02_17730 [Ignavibacteria bacterium]|nr:hypothetical protein [Ignavibacteria bacterium]